jgi:TolA-binding protein
MWAAEARAQSGEGGQSGDSFLFLTGRVVQSDGSAPKNGNIRVELVCGTRVQQQVFASEEGVFTLTVEREQQQGWMDASVGHDGALNQASPWNSSRDKPGVFAASAFQTFNLSGCKVRLSAGQELLATEINLSNRSVFDNPDIGILVIGREGQHSGTVMSVTSLSAPPKARKAHQKALSELSRKDPKFGKAAQNLKKAVEEYPGFSEAWFHLGQVQLRMDELDAAMGSFEESRKNDPRYLEPRMALARLVLYREEWPRAAELARECLNLSSGAVQAHYFNGLASYFLREIDQAESSFGFLKERGYGEKYPLALFHLAIIHAQKNQIQEAGDDFQQYLRVMPEAQFPPGQKEKIEQQLASWEKQRVWKPKPGSGAPE